MLAAVAAFLALFAPACSDGRKSVYPVRGSVLVEGQPSSYAIIVFHPVDGGRDDIRPRGHVDADGSFSLSTYNSNDGAPAGSYIVTLKSRKGRPDHADVRGEEPDEEDDEDMEAAPLIPKHYGDPKTSELRIEIKKGTNDLPPFELKKASW